MNEKELKGLKDFVEETKNAYDQLRTKMVVTCERLIKSSAFAKDGRTEIEKKEPLVFISGTGYYVSAVSSSYEERIYKVELTNADNENDKYHINVEALDIDELQPVIESLYNHCKSVAEKTE